MTNTNAHFGFALEYVTDVQASRSFFVDVLGLKVDRDHPTFVQFSDGNGASYAIASDERMDPTQAGVPELWWVVDDARSAFESMSRTAEVSMPLRQLPFGTCFGIKDPAGQAHYLLEFAAQRPSQPVA
jgi:catechol 2,3-dioxygenase-like lactoylglutathione lyase family enzyme